MRSFCPFFAPFPLEGSGPKASIAPVLDVPAVKLKNQIIIGHQALIFLPAVGALTTEKSLIPAAACFDVFHGNEGLRPHRSIPFDYY
jgi:hypothetical protein